LNELLEKNVYCPYCGEQISVVIEVLDENQESIEDCQVCCRPITFDVMMANDGQVSISVRSENDTF
jgi:transcription elongation factor Elf1